VTQFCPQHKTVQDNTEPQSDLLGRNARRRGQGMKELLFTSCGQLLPERASRVQGLLGLSRL